MTIGDVIECDMRFPTPHVYRVVIANEESLAFAETLVASGRWRVVTTNETPTTPRPS